MIKLIIFSIFFLSIDRLYAGTMLIYYHPVKKGETISDILWNKGVYPLYSGQEKLKDFLAYNQLSKSKARQMPVDYYFKFPQFYKKYASDYIKVSVLKNKKKTRIDAMYYRFMKRYPNFIERKRFYDLNWAATDENEEAFRKNTYIYFPVARRAHSYFTLFMGNFNGTYIQNNSQGKSETNKLLQYGLGGSFHLIGAKIFEKWWDFHTRIEMALIQTDYGTPIEKSINQRVALQKFSYLLFRPFLGAEFNEFYYLGIKENAEELQLKKYQAIYGELGVFVQLPMLKKSKLELSYKPRFSETDVDDVSAIDDKWRVSFLKEFIWKKKNWEIDTYFEQVRGENLNGQNYAFYLKYLFL